MPNFSNSKIYRIDCGVCKACYIGSTTTSLNAKLANHKRTTTSLINHVAQCCGNDWKNIKISLIENYSCTDREELHARESHWKQELQPSLNSSIPNVRYEPDGKVYYCKQCDVSFGRSYTLNQHFETDYHKNFNKPLYFSDGSNPFKFKLDLSCLSN